MFVSRVETRFFQFQVCVPAKEGRALPFHAKYSSVESYSHEIQVAHRQESTAVKAEVAREKSSYSLYTLEGMCLGEMVNEE